MFIPSLFTGFIIKNLGPPATVFSGLLLMVVGDLIFLSGTRFWMFAIALAVMGVGWNFGFVGSTAMLAQCRTNEEKDKVRKIQRPWLRKCAVGVGWHWFYYCCCRFRFFIFFFNPFTRVFFFLSFFFFAFVFDFAIAFVFFSLPRLFYKPLPPPPPHFNASSPFYLNG